MVWQSKIKTRTFSIALQAMLSIALASPGYDTSSEGEKDLTHVEAVEGYNASLPCSIQMPPLHDVPVLTLWYIGDQDTPVYSYDQRDASRKYIEWSDDRVFERGRAKYSPQQHPPLLTLTDVTTHDDRLYRCRVDYQKSNSRQTWIKLDVIVPPKNIEIIPRISPVEIGQIEDVLCKITGGTPQPKVEWLQEGRVVDARWLLDDRNNTYNLLEIPATRGDLSRPFTCRALNNKFTSPLKATFTRNVSCGPLSVTIEAETTPLIAERESKLTCTVIGSNPPPLVTWYMFGQEITTLRTRVEVGNNKTVSILRKYITREEHGRHLVCRAEHPTLPQDTQEGTIKLDVAYRPNVTLSLGRGIESTSLKEGNDIFFECNIDANPTPYKISWLHQGEELAHNKSAGVLVSETTLVLQSVQRYRSGKYNCFASNVEGDSLSNSIVIRIKYAPRCAMGPSLLGVALYELTNITCAVDADPTNVTFTWTFNNSVRRDQSEVINNTRYKQLGLKSTLSYTSMSERDYGTLLCFATNDVGRQKEPCSFTIISAGPPEEVTNCTVGNITSHSAGITCVKGFDGGLPQKFLLKVWNAESNKLVLNISEMSPVFSVKPLEPGLTYRAEVTPFNTRGSSTPATVAILTLNAAEMHKSLPSMVEPSPLVFVMGLVGGILLVIALLFFAVIYWLKKTSSTRQGSTSTQVVLKDSNPDLISVEASVDDPSLRESEPTNTNTTYDSINQSPEVTSYQRYGEDTTSLYRSTSPDVTERTRLTSTSLKPSTSKVGGGASGSVVAGAGREIGVGTMSGGGRGTGTGVGGPKVGTGAVAGARNTSKIKNVEEEGNMRANLLLYEDGVNRRASGEIEETGLRRDTVVRLFKGGREPQDPIL